MDQQLLNQLYLDYSQNLFPRNMRFTTVEKKEGQVHVQDSFQFLRYLQTYGPQGEDRGCHLTVYGADQWIHREGKRVRSPENPIIDKLYLDFDSEDLNESWEDYQKVVEWSIRLEFPIQSFFTGMKGFKVFINLYPYYFKYPWEMLYRIIYKIKEKLSLKTLEPEPGYRYMGLSRIPYTHHEVSGLWCYPLDQEYSLDEVLKHAQQKFPPIRKLKWIANHYWYDELVRLDYQGYTTPSFSTSIRLPSYLPAYLSLKWKFLSWFLNTDEITDGRGRILQLLIAPYLVNVRQWELREYKQWIVSWLVKNQADMRKYPDERLEKLYFVLQKKGFYPSRKWCLKNPIRKTELGWSL